MVKNGIYGYCDTKKNQMVYIGQSKNISLRHSHHINPIYYNEQVINRILQNNIDRYKLVIVKTNPTFSKNDRDILEKHYIEFYNTFNDDNKFNYTPGGDFNPSLLQSVKDKISNANTGRIRALDEKLKQSKTTNTSGYFRVTKDPNSTCKQGFLWCYRTTINNEKIKIRSVDIKKLESKVRARGLHWEKII